MLKTLIVYGTRKGASADTAAEIGRVLKEGFEHDVTISNVKHVNKLAGDLTQYDNIIIGSSIAMGRWTYSAKRFLRENDFAGKKLIIFVSAGATLQGAAAHKVTKEQAVDTAIKSYIDPVIAKANVAPLAKMAFGGRMTFFGKEVLNTWNASDIAVWAEEIGKRL